MATSKIKKNIELRFFLEPTLAKKISKTLKEDGFKSKNYSYTDLYFRHETFTNKFVKIRKWKIPKMKPEVIFFERKNGVKSEHRFKFNSIQAAVKFLEEKGYVPYIKVEKNKCIQFTKKGKSYVLEKIASLGWSGEVEIPIERKETMKDEINYFKSFGVKSFSLLPILEIIEQKLGIKKLKKPKIYRYRLLKI